MRTRWRMWLIRRLMAYHQRDFARSSSATVDSLSIDDAGITLTVRAQRTGSIPDPGLAHFPGGRLSLADDAATDAYLHDLRSQRNR